MPKKVCKSKKHKYPKHRKSPKVRRSRKSKHSCKCSKRSKRSRRSHKKKCTKDSPSYYSYTTTHGACGARARKHFFADKMTKPSSCDSCSTERKAQRKAVQGLWKQHKLSRTKPSSSASGSYLSSRPDWSAIEEEF
jgi:hypothetical protein